MGARASDARAEPEAEDVEDKTVRSPSGRRVGGEASPFQDLQPVIAALA